MEDKTNNGSTAQPANGTVSNNLNCSNNTTTISVYQGNNYARAEFDVVMDVIGKIIVTDGDLRNYTLEDLSEMVQSEMMNLVAMVRLPISQGGRGLKWTVPKNISPVQAALILLEKETVRLVCTKENINKPVTSGILAVYQKDGESAGIYREIGDNQIDEWSTSLGGAVDKKWRNEFYAKIHDAAKRVCECDNPNYVYMKNGILNYETKELLEFSPDIVTLRKSPVELPESEPPVPIHTKPDGSKITFWEWLTSLVPYDGGQELLIKLVGAVLRNHHNWRVMVTLFNKTGRNGKSTFLKMVKCCVGHESVMTSTISNLCDFRFGLSNLPGCALITCEDSDSGSYIRNTSRIKCVISHDSVSVERKNQDLFDYTPNAMVICASNDLPRTKDKGSAWLDRNYYVPFTGQFTGADDDKTISSHWVVSEEFCSYMAYQALVKCENYYELPEPEEAAILKKEFMADNDAVVEFFNIVNETWKLDFIPNNHLWVKYREWLREYRPNTNLQTQKSFIVHFTEVAVSSGEWVQPKEKNGKCRRFKVTAWCVHKDFKNSNPTLIVDSPEYSSGIIRKQIWEYCQNNNTTPYSLGNDYGAIRKQLGLAD